GQQRDRAGQQRDHQLRDRGRAQPEQADLDRADAFLRAGHRVVDRVGGVVAVRLEEVDQRAPGAAGPVIVGPVVPGLAELIVPVLAVPVIVVTVVTVVAPTVTVAIVASASVVALVAGLVVIVAALVAGLVVIVAAFVAGLVVAAVLVVPASGALI